jgi:serine/threonine protein phosphatase PrpC
MALSIETCAAQHIGDRAEQQDRLALFKHPSRKGTLLAVLADGMGGYAGGAVAAEQVLHMAKNNFDGFAPTAESVQEMLAAGINDAHSGIRITRYTSEQDPHSTACLFMLQPGRADWAHCGDSRIYHFRDGQLLARSDDHSFVADLVRSGLLTPQQAETHPKRNILLSCLGDNEAPKIAFGAAEPLQAGDCFVLCSDGLWGYFPDAELGDALASFPPRRAAEVLIERARQRGNGRGDNISLIIIKLVEVPDKPKWPGPPGGAS